MAPLIPGGRFTSNVSSEIVRRTTINTTLDRDPEGGRPADERAHVALTILGHPDVARIGEVAILEPKALLSRISPNFSPPGVGDRAPLDDPGISRKPIHLAVRSDGGLEIQEIEGGAPQADGIDLRPSTVLSAAAIDRGVVLAIGRVALLLHRTKIQPRRGESLGLVGESTALHELRREILAIGALDVPVLLRGETGTGKELVARAIHDASARKDAAYQAVNMAAIPASVAASELFGHRRGAFTGADDAKDGIFKRAHRGTLFLDEIGETPPDVQSILLRAIELSAIQPVGGQGEETIDVRIISATDADLESAVKKGIFRAPLLHRLAGYVLHLPPLRARRDDIGRLLFHFLREELGRLNAASRLDFNDPRDTPWISAEAVARLARYDWPGNVRQLRNVARQLAITARDDLVRADERLERLLPAEEARPPIEEEAARSARKPRDIRDDELERVLVKHRFSLEAASNELGISRASLYALIEKSSHFRTAKDVGDEELLAAYHSTQGNFERMSEMLRVSSDGLRRRIKQLVG